MSVVSLYVRNDIDDFWNFSSVLQIVSISWFFFKILF